MPTCETRRICGPQAGETPVVWKCVAAPTSAIAAPARTREATLRARVQALASLRLRMEPSHAKLNWQPVRRPAPWKTTPQTDFGKAGWRTRFMTTWATANWPVGFSPRAS